MSDPVALALAAILAEALDDRRFRQLARESVDDLAPRRLPPSQLEHRVTATVDEALKEFARLEGVRDLLHDAVMEALEGWYEPHEW